MKMTQGLGERSESLYRSRRWTRRGKSEQGREVWKGGSGGSHGTWWRDQLFEQCIVGGEDDDKSVKSGMAAVGVRSTLLMNASSPCEGCEQHRPLHADPLMLVTHRCQRLLR